MLPHMLDDLLTSYRRAVRYPLFSLTLVAILGVGIGATTTMVSVLDTLLWRQVAMPQGSALVAITTVLPDGARRGLPLASAERVTRAALPVDAWCDDMFWNGLVVERMATVVSIGAAALGVVLAMLGLYALLAHSVAMRTREIGIRVAVGAAPWSIRALIFRHMLALVLGGVVVGVPAALMGTAVLQSLMFGLSTTDRVTLAAAVVLVGVVGAAASAVPAVRASRVDPVRLLRAE